ncbi:MAG: heme biosynthesis HemY N-terminal domain-containing protein [Halopseudomonas sp.]|uniref:heme biosynthesis HemY N-terminal domain-containing protein n=1 Tax=Halopseudomonas sp. TaxID=2901191 RepID=UPI0030031CCF
MSKSYIAILAVLLVAALLGMAVAEDPGYLLIAWRNFSIETSVWVGLGFLLAFWLLLMLARALIRVLNASGRRINPWSRRNQQQRANAIATRGLLEFAEGHWKSALRLLKKSAPHAELPLINYLAAARAAHELEDYSECDSLLREAYETTPKADVAIAVTQAQLQIGRGQLEQALATLTRLRKEHPKHLYALKLMSQVYLRLEDWGRLLELLPELRKQQVLKPADQDALEYQVHLALLQQAGQRAAPADTDPASLVVAAWERMPKRMHEDPAVVEAYCLQLRGKGREMLAEEALRNALQGSYNERLVHLYGLVQGRDSARQLATAEQWLPQHPNNATLLLALGRLAQRNSLWGKARDYLEASFSSKRDIQTCAELARLLDRMGEQQASRAVINDGFDLLEESLPTLPLPSR